MQKAIEVLVPIPRRWAAGRRRSSSSFLATHDLRLILLMALVGAVFWSAVAWLLAALL